ncbi:MAG: hypothetical protein GVY17_01940 [Cyanobacteria bacterium]|jgi:plasmid stability protein|nr:hypothetical protein [Cyanobacteria bacterium GSL.Bin21]
MKSMSDKQKVTLYLPPDVHRNLKIKAATGGESMSGLVEQAVIFYLNHSEVVEEFEQQEHGQTYRLYECPQCESALIMQDGELTPLEAQPSVQTEEIATEQVNQQVKTADHDHPQDQEQLVPC